MSTPSLTEINGRIRMLELQRDRALDEAVALHGRLAFMDAENKRLEEIIKKKSKQTKSQETVKP